jgi:serine/threonine protein kinase
MHDEGFSLFDLAPGKRVAERFRVVRPHRQSGLATTLEVIEEPGGERRELTVFPSALFEGPAQAEAYRRTWEPWMGVVSPHVLRVREALTLPHSTVALVTDFPAGPTLRDWMREHGRMDSARAIDVGLQLLDGLTAIHAAGLVHGDVKPQTIYLPPSEGQLRGLLVDGGITTGLWNAKHLGERTALIGTPFYAPVEQFGGESPDVQSDIYNLATVLFELITGVLPWPGSTLLEVFQAKLDRNPPSMRKRAPGLEIQPELEEAICAGLLADRARRYAKAEDFRRDLAAAKRP